MLNLKVELIFLYLITKLMRLDHRLIFILLDNIVGTCFFNFSKQQINDY